MLETIIKGGMVIDGSGKNPAFNSDVGISNGKISEIGDLSKTRAHRIINAKDCIVCPGFIDIQNHSDSYGTLLSSPTLESMLHQGITSVLVGHGGSSLAPLLKGSLASIQKWTNITGINVDWRSMAEFLDIVHVKGSGPNIATLVGHGTLRRDLSGGEMRPLSETEQQQMASLLKRSLNEGAWGLSLGLQYTHEQSAEHNEIVSALNVVKKSSGIASFHLRDEHKGFMPSLNEIIDLTKESGVRAKISRFKVEHETNPSVADDAIKSLSNARSKGVDMYIDVYPYEVSASTLYLLLPAWLTSGGRKELLNRLSQKSMYEDAVREMKGMNHKYEEIIIASGTAGRSIVGKTISLLAQNQGKEPEEIILNAIIASEDQLIVFYKNSSEELFDRFVKWPYAMVATNGVGYVVDQKIQRDLPHPRSFGATARLLGHFVRDKKILTLEEAVFKMTGLPAEFMGLKNRGLLQKGSFADVVVFNPSEISDRSTYLQPRIPDGIEQVFINGVSALENGSLTGATPGIVLHK